MTISDAEIFCLFLVSLAIGARRLLGSKEADTKPPTEPPSKFTGWMVWKRVLLLALPEAPFILLAFFSSMTESICSSLQPFYLGQAFDMVSITAAKASFDVEKSIAALTSFFLVILALETLKSIATYGRERFNNNVGDFVRQRAQTLFFGNILRNEVAFFDKTHTSELNKKYSTLDDIHFLAGHQIPSIVQCSLTLILRGIFMIQSNGYLGGGIVALLILQGAIEMYLDKLVKTSWKALRKIEKSGNRMREEAFSHARTIKAFSNEAKEHRRFSDMLDKDRAIRARLVNIWGTRRGVGAALMACNSAIVYYFGLRQVLSGESTVGEVMSFAMLAASVKDSANGLLTTYNQSLDKTRNLRHTFEMLDRPSEIPIDRGEKVDRAGLRGEVTLRGVRFAYASRPDREVLHGVDLSLRPGTVTALCGGSGGGKSSVAGLVLRDHDVTAGSVCFDGKDVRTLNLCSLHGCMAVVSQESTLFSGSIEENILYGLGRDNVPLAEVEEAARKANAHEFIIKFEEGYKTQVGENGVRLSGGQKQRIAIARAILRDPRVLILDEATSALDAETEHLVQDALDRIMVGRTTLIIAHRLSTIRAADNIVVISEGRVAEQGSHDELVAKRGAYAGLIALQLQSADDRMAEQMAAARPAVASRARASRPTYAGALKAVVRAARAAATHAVAADLDPHAARSLPPRTRASGTDSEATRRRASPGRRFLPVHFLARFLPRPIGCALTRCRRRTAMEEKERGLKELFDCARSAP